MAAALAQFERAHSEQQAPFDIVFADIGMPRMDGYEAARQIRAMLGGRVVLVALTGWGQDDDKRRSHDAGFDHHLTKPPEPERLDQLIEQCAESDGPAGIS